MMFKTQHRSDKRECWRWTHKPPAAWDCVTLGKQHTHTTHRFEFCEQTPYTHNTHRSEFSEAAVTHSKGSRQRTGDSWERNGSHPSGSAHTHTSFTCVCPLGMNVLLQELNALQRVSRSESLQAQSRNNADKPD